MVLFVAEREALWAKALEEIRQELGELAESGRAEKRKREIEEEPKPKKKPKKCVVDPPELRRSPRDTPQRNYCAGQAEFDPDWYPSDDEEPRKSRPRKKVSTDGRRTRRAESPPPDRGGKRRRQQRQQKLPESELDHCDDEVCFVF